MTEISLTANRTKSSLMGLEELDHFTTQKEFTRCGIFDFRILRAALGQVQ